jgi:hypothetical protein
MGMRNFTCSGISAFFVLALAGCPGNPPPHLVDAFHPTTDMGTTPPVDTNPMATPDMNLPRVDMGGTPGLCGFGTGGCDLIATSACPMDGTTRQGCYITDTGTMCMAAGTATSGACTNLNGCERGYACVGPDATHTACEHVCCSAADCSPGEMCNPIGDSTGAALPNGIGTCHRPTACTVVPNSGCAAMQQCTVVAADGSTDCRGTGTGTEGMPCASTGCVEGLGCYGPAMGTATCVRLCRLGMNGDCMAAHPTCNAHGLGATYGLCD